MNVMLAWVGAVPSRVLCKGGISSMLIKSRRCRGSIRMTELKTYSRKYCCRLFLIQRNTRVTKCIYFYLALETKLKMHKLVPVIKMACLTVVAKLCLCSERTQLQGVVLRQRDLLLEQIRH